MWMAQEFLPFQYPVAALVVDDDPSLLGSLWAGLQRDRRVLAADSSPQALERYNQARQPRRAFMRRSTDQTRLDEHRVVVDTAAITALIDDASRHQEIGLLVVDYQMPELNGIELCEALRHEPCRRILLTGMADERIATQAFNAGLIHQFVRKDHDMLDRLNATLRQEQLAYFRQASLSLNDSLRDRLGAFEHEPAVREALQTLLQEVQAGEYYLCTQPNGLLIQDTKGKRRRILVQSDEERRSALEILGATGSEKGLMGAMVYVDVAREAGRAPTARAVSPLMQVKVPTGVYRFAVEDC